MHILIAPNAFKNSLPANAVADAISSGLLHSKLVCSTECFPVGDGGDGTGKLIVDRHGGTWIQGEVHDALGRSVIASFGLIDEGKTGVIEMAAAAGIGLISREELDPLVATSFGTGEQIKMALENGVKKLIIGMGGSATVDGGVGILQALGARFLDASGHTLQDIPGSLVELHSIDLSAMDMRFLEIEIIVLCDVENTLLGPQGAAWVFGPQKGATPQAVEQLNASLATLAKVALEQIGKDMATVAHGGTAGGAAAGLYAFLNARLVNGIDYFLTLTDFDASLERAELVITGEGSIDEQTLHGKAPFGVASKAKQRSLPVVAFAGKVPIAGDPALNTYFDALLPIGHEPLDLAAALGATETNLIRTAEALGNLLALRP